MPHCPIADDANELDVWCSTCSRKFRSDVALTRHSRTYDDNARSFRSSATDATIKSFTELLILSQASDSLPGRDHFVRSLLYVRARSPFVVQWLGVELCKLSLQASKIHFCIHKM